MPTYDRPKVVADICEDISKGKSLRWCCEQEGRPHLNSFLDWIEADEALRQQYTRARARQADYLADELIEIVDTEDDPARARVRMDARKWAAGKMAPKKYGDKVDVKHSGDADNPVIIKRIERIIVAPVDDKPKD